MKCPHCLVEFHAERTIQDLGDDSEGGWGVMRYACPNGDCKKMILFLAKGHWNRTSLGSQIVNITYTQLVRPKGVSRAPLPPEVPDQFSSDYREACMVLADSPKASAALSRRCLQLLLRDVAKVKHGSLADEIQAVIDKGHLPSFLVESLDAVRNIGNFATHPLKSKSTGEIVPIEPGEAEWNLDVLEALFDFYFIQPAILKKKKTALNLKLKDAGKPPMKE